MRQFVFQQKEEKMVFLDFLHSLSFYSPIILCPKNDERVDFKYRIRKKKKDQIDIGSKVVGHISELVIKFKLYSKVEALRIA